MSETDTPKRQEDVYGSSPDNVYKVLSDMRYALEDCVADLEQIDPFNTSAKVGRNVLERLAKAV